MKIILTVLAGLFVFNSNASAFILICESKNKAPNGKALTAYRFNDRTRTAEKWIYTSAKSGYLLMNFEENLEFTDQIHRMSPVRRAISANQGQKEIFYAYQNMGNTYFTAKVTDEGPGFNFDCRWKE